MKRRLKVAVAVVLVLVLLAGAALGSYALLHLNRKNSGIELVPSADIPLADVTAYLQNDPAWAADLLGDSRYGMGGYGCLVSCVAMAAEHHLGQTLDPGTLNTRLSAAGGYSDGELLWDRLGQAVPGLSYRSVRIFTARTLGRDLAAGLLPIVKVRVRGTGAQHWVLVVGAQNGEFMVMDPLNAGREAIPLSTHGRVYAYRVVLPVQAAG